jgi:hypothetical protein
MIKSSQDGQMQKYFSIEFCKIFVNPKIFREPGMYDNTLYHIRYSRYTVVVHYSPSEDRDWEEYDI